jgi:hypothetical protein
VCVCVCVCVCVVCVCVCVCVRGGAVVLLCRAKIKNHVLVCGMPQRLRDFLLPFRLGLNGNKIHLNTKNLHSHISTTRVEAEDYQESKSAVCPHPLIH